MRPNLPDPLQLIKQLRATLPREQALLQRIAAFEEALLQGVTLAAISLIGGTVVLPPTHTASNGQTVIQSDNGPLLLLVERARWDNKSLVVCVRQPNASPSHAEMEVEDSTVGQSWGRINRVRIEVQRNCLSGATAFISEMTSASAEFCLAFYAALLEEIRTDGDRDHERLAADLYSILRRHTYQVQAAAGRIYLYAAFKYGDKFLAKYIPDTLQRERILHTLVQRDTFLSPAESLVLFTDTLLPLEATFTNEAIDQMRRGGAGIVSGNFGSARYHANPVALSEVLVYDAGGNAVQGLVEEGDVLIAAGYPAQLQPVAAHLLRASRPEMAAAVRQHRKRYLDKIRRLIDIDNRPTVAGALGDFCGKIMVAFWGYFERKGGSFS